MAMLIAPPRKMWLDINVLLLTHVYVWAPKGQRRYYRRSEITKFEEEAAEL